MPRRGSRTQQPSSSSRAPRGTRQPVSVAGPSRRDDRSALPTAPPPFSTVAPPGHAMPQPVEEEYDGYDDMEGPSYAPSRMGRTSASNFDRGRGHAHGLSRYGNRTTRTARPARMSTLQGDEERTRTGMRRATTIAPTRATAIDVEDHGVFESDEEEEGATVQPSTYADPRTPTGRNTIGGTRTPERPVPRGQAQTPMPPTRRPGASNIAGGTVPGRSSRTQRPTQYDRGVARPSSRTQADCPNLGAVNEEEEAVEDDTELPADSVRAQIQWFDPRHPPPPKPRGYRDENLIYQIEGDDYEVYQYSIPSERADGGVSILREIDRRAQHLRDPHFSSLELWMRAQNSGFLRKIIDNDEGYSYWTIENHNYDIAWACAQQGWWILGVGVGKDKGNFFMEQKDGRS